MATDPLQRLLTRRPWLARPGLFTHGFTRAAACDERTQRDIGTRLIAAYRRAQADAPQAAREPDVWSGILAACYGEFAALLERGDPLELTSYLSALPRQPAGHGYFQGRVAFDSLNADPAAQHLRAHALMDYLAGMAEAVGVLPVRSPEQPGWDAFDGVSAAQLRQAIETALGAPIALPPVFDGLFALEPDYAPLHLRSVMATYAVWQLLALLRGCGGVDAAQARVAEIGAGIGYTALAAHAFGVGAYVIYDLPLINVAQGYFLLRSAAAERVALYGESASGKSLFVHPAFSFHAVEPMSYTAVMNMDSLPEIARSEAERYIATTARSAAWFFSLNQETEATQAGDTRQPRVAELVAAHGGYRAVLRSPDWIRPGYVDELWRVAR